MFDKYGYTFRPVKDGDADALISMIGGCFAEYADQGVMIDLDNLDNDLFAYATHMKTINGEAFVLCDGEDIIACFSYAKHTDDVFELKRFYLRADKRGEGLANAMLRHLEDTVRQKGAKSFFLWSDTRFKRAHSFYAREGFVKQADTRYLDDISNTTEYHFLKEY